MATNVDAGTTPYYEIKRWVATSTSWLSVVPRTNMTVKIASSTWEASYPIDNNDFQIGLKYSVTFNARIGGAQMAQLQEFAVVQETGGDPVTVVAAPIRATANDTVRLTIRESNLNATVLTGNAANTFVYVYDPSNTLQVNGSNPTELANGPYYFNYSLGASPTNGVWQAMIKVTIGTGSYSAATNFEVNYQPAKETSSQTIVTNQATASTTIANKIDTATSTIITNINSTITAASSSIGSKIDTATTTVANILRGKILNQETFIKTGSSTVIMFKTASGLTGSDRPTLTIYDPSFTQVGSTLTMIEQVAGSGIYATSTTFQTSWGTGNFFLRAAETKQGTSDSMNLLVISTDLPTIESKIIEELAKALVVLFVILRLPTNGSRILGGALFGFLFGMSESVFYLNNIFQLGDFSILWQRFLWTVPMHIITALVIVLSGLAGKKFLIFGFIGAVVLHMLFNSLAF